jgi:hypothetical protein
MNWLQLYKIRLKCLNEASFSTNDISKILKRHRITSGDARSGKENHNNCKKHQK